MFERYHRELLNFLAGLVRDRDTAADLALESYVRVLAVQHAGRPIHDPRALLYSTARNLAIDGHRRAAHRDHVDIDGWVEADQPRAPAATQPEQAVASAQAVRALLASSKHGSGACPCCWRLSLPADCSRPW